jgi:hypothetical protein
LDAASISHFLDVVKGCELFTGGLLDLQLSIFRFAAKTRHSHTTKRIRNLRRNMKAKGRIGINDSFTARIRTAAIVAATSRPPPTRA